MWGTSKSDLTPPAMSCVQAGRQLVLCGWWGTSLFILVPGACNGGVAVLVLANVARRAN